MQCRIYRPTNQPTNLSTKLWSGFGVYVDNRHIGHDFLIDLSDY